VLVSGEIFNAKLFGGIGKHEIDYWSIDNAGNTEEEHTIIFYIVEEFPIPDLYTTSDMSWSNVKTNASIYG